MYVLAIFFYSMFCIVPVFETSENKCFDSNIFLVVNVTVHFDLPLIVNPTGLVESVLQKYVYDMVIAVEEIFRHPAMRMPLKINIGKISYLWSIASLTQIISHDDMFLRYYCDWQRNIKDDGIFSLIITGLSNDNANGATYFKGHCKKHNSCMYLVFNKKPENIAVVLAHELAHSLGALHDGTQGCSKGYYYMAPVFDYLLPYPTNWTNCSRNEVENFLLNPIESWCFGNDDFRTKLAKLSYE